MLSFYQTDIYCISLERVWRSRSISRMIQWILTVKKASLSSNTTKLFEFLMNRSSTLIKKKIKFSSYTRKFRWEQFQSNIWLTASSFMEIFVHFLIYIRKPFLIYDFATAPLWIYLYMRKILFSFLSVHFPMCSWSKYTRWRKKQFTSVFNFCPEACCRMGWGQGE